MVLRLYRIRRHKGPESGTQWDKQTATPACALVDPRERERENGMTNIMAAKIVVTAVLGTAAALMLYGLWSIIDLWLIPMKPFKSVAEEKFMLRLMEEWAREGTLSVDRYTKREREYLKHLVEIGFVGVSEGSESGGDDEGNDSGQQGKDGH